MEFDKLVRDKIPFILKDKGIEAVVTRVGRYNHEAYLLKKLREEVEEVAQDKNIDELADVLEVVLALCNYYGYSTKDLESALLNKREKVGAFNEGYILIRTKNNLLRKK